MNKKGCGKVVFGNEEMGTLNCGNRIGKWDKDGIWEWTNELWLCKSCLKEKKEDET